MGDHVVRPRRKLKHRFYVAPSRVPSPPDASELVIDRDTAHHVRNVLRLASGAAVILFDNTGKEYEAELVECKPSRVTARIISAAFPAVESPLKITLAQALIKGNSFDKLITLSAELGCARIIPLFTARTVLKLGKAAAADRVKRWERIAQEAAAQSGRVKVPVVEMPLEFKEFLARQSQGLNIILYERGGVGQLREMLKDVEGGQSEAMTLLAGPEGGFEPAEVELAINSGFKVWGLGPRVLRAENAGAIAMSILQYHCGDMG